MSYWICKEVQTDNGGYFEPVNPLIRCKDCFWHKKINFCGLLKKYGFFEDDYCSLAERKEEC